MKIKFTILLLIIILCNISYVTDAQNTCISFNNKDLDKFLHSTTKVALVGNEKYDAAIKSAVEQYWTITKVEYFQYSDLMKKKMLKDESSSFLLPFVYSWFGSNFEANEMRFWNPAGGFDLWLTVVMGGTNGSVAYNDYSVLAYAPIDNFGNEMEMFNCTHRLGFMVKGLQDAITIVKDKSLKEAPLYVLRDVLGEMSKKAGVLKTKTLLVNENILKNENYKKKISLTADVLKTYKFNYKVVPQSEIEEAIKNKDKQYCYLCPVFESNKNIFIYNLETGETIYGTYEWKGMAVTKEDISKLNAAISNAK